MLHLETLSSLANSMVYLALQVSLNPSVISWTIFVLSLWGTYPDLLLPLQVGTFVSSVITSVEAKVAPGDRVAKPTLCSLESMAVDFERFSAAGADLDSAKLFNNAISPPFFDISLDQVSVPLYSL